MNGQITAEIGDAVAPIAPNVSRHHVTDARNLMPPYADDRLWIGHALSQVKRGYTHSVFCDGFVISFFEAHGRLVARAVSTRTGLKVVIESQWAPTDGLLRLLLRFAVKAMSDLQ
jgi:hypothetical protein